MSTIHTFKFDTNDPNGMPGPWVMSSVVVSLEEWDDLMKIMKSIQQTIMQSPQSYQLRITDEQIESIRESRHIPLMARGGLTEKVFRYLKVETDFLTVLVRGEGLNLARRMGYVGNGDPN